MDVLVTATEEISSTKRHKQSYELETDLLSNLPDVLIFDILSLLQAKDVVRTSALSKRWSHLWKHIHCIKLCLMQYQMGCASPASAGFDKFLSDLDDSEIIKKFYVKLECHEDDCKLLYPQVDSWVKWALKRGVEILKVDVKSTRWLYRTFYQVPAVLFQCQFFVELELGNSELNMHNMSVSWPILKTMNLTDVLLNASDLDILMNSCPLLERLILERCVFGTSGERCYQIRICSSTVRFLRLWDCKHKYNYKVVIALPSLVKISINMIMYHQGIEQIAVLNAVNFVEEVHVGDRCIRALAAYAVNHSASVRFAWVEISLENRRYLAGMANLISSYSNLQTLAIEFTKTGSLKEGPCIKILEDFLSGKILQLKRIHVHGILDVEVMLLTGGEKGFVSLPELAIMKGNMKMDVVRTLLRHAKCLEEFLVTVDFYKHLTLLKSESLVVENLTTLLEKFEKASSLVHTIVRKRREIG